MTDVPVQPTPSDGRLTLTTCGGADLAAGGSQVLGPGKPLALITYLALAPGRAASREFLIDLLWADLDHSHGRHALRQTVWQLRRQFGDAIVTGRDELSIGLPIDNDRDRFLAAIEGGQPELAVTLYRGDFLPGFALPGSHEFELWADGERSRLRGAFLLAAEMTVRRFQAAGRVRDAQAVARRMRDTDPGHEAGWRLLLETLSAAGDHLQAAVEAEALRAHLAADERAPEPATKALLERIGRGGQREQEPAADHALIAELIGREAEFAAVLEAWGRAKTGSSTHVHIVAPAGFGKTRLLADAAHRLRSIGARVIPIRANPGDRGVPFATVGDLATALGPLAGLAGVSPAAAGVLIGLSPSLSSRFPHAEASAAHPEPIRLRTAALAEALAAIADERPVALLVDDVHWLDPESHQVLEGLINRLASTAALVITASRPGIGRPLATPTTFLVEPAPLDRAAVQSLFVSLGRPADDCQLETIVDLLHRSSGGSPLLVLESLQLALDRGSLHLEAGTWSVPELTRLQAELEAGNTLRERLTELHPDASWILLVLAALGTPLTTSEVTEVVRTREAVDEQLWHLERRGLLRRNGSSWEPAHDEIAAAAHEMATPERRRAAHLAAGRLLLASPQMGMGQALGAARHFEQAADDQSLRMAFRALVGRARNAGDRRGFLSLARSVVSSEDAARRLVRSLPLRARLGLDSTARLAAAVAGTFLLGAVAIAATSLVRDNGSDGLLVVFDHHPGEPGATNARTFRWSPDSWRGGRPIAPRLGSTVVREPMLATAGSGRVAMSADGSMWVFNAPVDDSVTDEIFLHENGRTRLLIGAPRDDGLPDLSPSGRTVAFVTARWSPPGDDDYDIAVADIARPEVASKLTSSRDHDVGPYWSPHGKLIAFTRRPRALAPRQACWVTTNPGSPVEHCVVPPVGEVTDVIGWVDGSRVLIITEDDGGKYLTRWNIIGDHFSPPDQLPAGKIIASPDGKWAACFCVESPGEPPAMQIFPINDPGSRRPLTGLAGPRSIGWRSVAASSQAEFLRVGKTVTVPVGSPHALEVRVNSRAGEPIPVPRAAVLLASRDSSVVGIDSADGRIRGLRPGTAVVVARLSDLVDSVRVEVSTDTAVTVIDERWDTIDSTRWLAYGNPRPRLVRAGDGSLSLNNGGDGKYESGVVTAEAFDPAVGFGLEVRLSTPVTRSNWQHQRLQVLSERNQPVDGWDRRTGSPGAGAGFEECGLAYPAGEGLGNIHRIALQAIGRSPPPLRVDSTWPHGAWHSVRLQVFPDGSCGFAIDGTAVWRSTTRAPVDQRYRIWIGGNSAGTDKILVGRVQVWSGVRAGVDWDELSPKLKHPER